MSMREFLRQNRAEIDRFIRSQVDMERINNRERELWVRNDESLYRWARGCGVNI